MPLLVNEGKVLLETIKTECEIRTGRQGWCSGQRRAFSRAARRCSTGDPTVVNALELPPEGAEVRGLHIRPFPAMESVTFDYGRDPDANALYLFTLGGLRVLHMGAIGNPVPQEHLDALHGNVDLLFALTGAHATIALEDLDVAIEAIGPRGVIPMHYYSPRGVLEIEPVDTFLERHPAESITQVGGPELELTPETLPAGTPHIYVLEQSR